MSKRIDNECAWCAETIQAERECIGSDRKIYCSTDCRTSGEQNSLFEWQQIMRHAVPSRDYISPQK